MRTTLFLLMLIQSAVTFTQTQDPARAVQSYPQLQEWWRADNKSYGHYGATWLDNFYHGKGALVVYTPTALQTWLLEYPGDTNNVFTWKGGYSADIKTLDINGDGIRDYLNGNGMLWLGIQNGEPPAETPSAVLTGANTEEYKVVDLNRDGLDDLLSFRKSSSPFFIIRTFFGNKTSIPTVFVEYPMVGMDTTDEFHNIYTMPSGEVRVTAHRKPYSQIEKAYMQDSWVIYKAVWDSTTKVLRLEQMAILGTTQTYATLGYDRIITRGDRSFLLLFQKRTGTKVISEGALLKYAHVYDVSDDTFIRKQTAAIDSMSLFLLNKDITGDGLSDCYYLKENHETNRSSAIAIPFTDSLEYSKSTSNEFSPVKMVVAARDFKGDNKNDIIVIADYELSVLLSGVTTDIEADVNSESQQQSLNCFYDATKDMVIIQMQTESRENADILISDIKGAEIIRSEVAPISISNYKQQYTIQVPHLIAGAYILSLRTTSSTFSTKFIIE